MKIYFTGAIQLPVESIERLGFELVPPEEAEVIFVRFDHNPPNPLPPNVRVLCTNMSDPRWVLSLNANVKIVTTKDIYLEDITSTIEHTWGLIHAAHRRITAVAQDPYGYRDDWIVPCSLKYSVITIIGAGRVGKGVARVANAFLSPANLIDVGHPKNDLMEILSLTDILVCCVSRNEVNPVVTAEMLETLPEGAIVVNTSYGEAVDLRSLLSLLTSGHLFAAALDVLPRLTLALDVAIQNLIEAGRLIVTPHIAGSTTVDRRETEKRILNEVFQLQ